MTERRRRAGLVAGWMPASAALALAAAGLAAAAPGTQRPDTRPAAGAFVRAAAAHAADPARSWPANASASAPADSVSRWRPFVDEAARRFGVPAAWIERVMRAESGGRTTLNGRPLVSPAGAMGLMQLIPATWAELRAAYGLGGDPFDPKDNILAGTAYLAALYRRFGYPGLFGAYNAGPARYAAWLAGRARLPDETRVYLARVGGGGDPPGLFEVADARAPGGTGGETAASPAAPHAAVGGRGAGAPTQVRPDRGSLFAVERAGGTLAGEAAPKAAGRPAGGLFVALSNPPPPAPED